MSHEIQFNLIDEIQNIKKLNTPESEKGKEKIVTELFWYLLFSRAPQKQVDGGSFKTFMKWFEVFKNKVITFG